MSADNTGGGGGTPKSQGKVPYLPPLIRTVRLPLLAQVTPSGGCNPAGCGPQQCAPLGCPPVRPA